MIDYIGKVLLPTEYDSLDYVTKDVVIVTKDSKYGAVDINNRLVLPFEYDDIRFDIGIHNQLLLNILQVISQKYGRKF